MPTAARERSFAAQTNRLVYALSRHWLLGVSLLLGLYVGLPWLAPVFMQLGWTTAGRLIYLLYSTQCHQLPQRSYFLFGPQATYSLPAIQAAWKMTDNLLVLRQFMGSPALGWKVAWSERMVSLYTSLWGFGLLYGLVRQRARPLPWPGFILLALPMVIDGGAHFLSDWAGLGQGFRDTNAWLAALTDQALPAAFYAGDGLGSFNSWMRLLTGALFGLGVVWTIYPYFEAMFADLAREVELKFEQAGLRLN